MRATSSGVELVNGLGALRVIVHEESSGKWLVESLEIPLITQDVSPTAAQFRFVDALIGIIEVHQRHKISLKRLLTHDAVAAEHVAELLHEAGRKQFARTVFKLHDTPEEFPFSEVHFFEARNW